MYDYTVNRYAGMIDCVMVFIKLRSNGTMFTGIGLGVRWGGGDLVEHIELFFPTVALLRLSSTML